MKIGIIGAMNEEIERMLEKMDTEQKHVIANVIFYEGLLENKSIVLCKSGVGKVNAAITTQLLIDHFHVENIIFTGVAGALNPKLNITDIVISSSAMQHDMDASPLGFKRGEIPYFEQSSDFKADPKLIEIATEASKQLEGIQVMQGKVLSGDQFIADPNVVKDLYENFEGACIEMEGSAVAQTAILNEIPFVIIRSISDKANGDANVNFMEFVHTAAKHSNFIVNEMLKQM